MEDKGLFAALYKGCIVLYKYRPSSSAPVAGSLLWRWPLYFVGRKRTLETSTARSTLFSIFTLLRHRNERAVDDGLKWFVLLGEITDAGGGFIVETSRLSGRSAGDLGATDTPARPPPPPGGRDIHV